MNVSIRHETPNDYRTVETITREAFWNLHCPGCSEHLIAHHLRKHRDFMPELTFVIECDGEIVGSIFYSYSKVIDAANHEHKIISFGPVSIAPGLHRRGLGRQLITHSINEAKRLGHRAIIIGGYPYHYKPYGFEGSKKYGISMPDGKYYTGIMALELYPGALSGITGAVHFSEGMYPDDNELEAFEKNFPPKKKAVTESQREFEKAVAEIDKREYV